MNIFNVIKKPLITEKAALTKEMSGNTYVFRVDVRADKDMIKKSIESLFNVKVSAVRTTIVRGKRKRFGQSIGQTPAYKKAMVKLLSGKIELFEGV